MLSRRRSRWITPTRSCRTLSISAACLAKSRCSSGSPPRRSQDMYSVLTVPSGARSRPSARGTRPLNSAGMSRLISCRNAASRVRNTGKTRLTSFSARCSSTPCPASGKRACSRDTTRRYVGTRLTTTYPSDSSGIRVRRTSKVKRSVSSPAWISATLRSSTAWTLAPMNGTRTPGRPRRKWWGPASTSNPSWALKALTVSRSATGSRCSSMSWPPQVRRPNASAGSGRASTAAMRKSCGRSAAASYGRGLPT